VGSQTAATEFRVLGPIEATRAGASLPLGGPRQRALLALLLIEAGRPVASDRLAEELWQGRPPAGAQTTLRSYVSRLRSVLEVTVAIGPSGYALDVPPEQVDAARFERLVEEGRAALARRAPRRAAERLGAALALWRGAPFAGVHDEGALRLAAERLTELRLLALEDRLDAELELGANAELVEELETLVAEHPYRERFWRHLMLALYRAQRQADALDAYQRARAILHDDLGLEPGNELRALEQAILQHEVPPVRPPEERHNLPAPLSSFVGREVELAEVERLLAEARLVTLTGVGGVGKTRLALEAARRGLPDFPEAVFVDLSSVSRAESVASRVAAGLAVREQTDVQLEQQIAGRIGSSRLLLVLDNCEHVREAASTLLASVLPLCPELHVLATSREFLGCEGETAYPVPPLEAADAVDLFLARARAVRPRLVDDGRARDTVVAICSDLDGLPLAIELAAARVRALALDEIATRLADRFQFLVSWRRLSPARHRTLERAMDWSYELLSPTEQALLARLSVFAGGFTLASAAAVALEANEDETLPHLERLVDASLIIAEEHEGAMRYRLLETVRQYGAQRLRERDELENVRRRHAQYLADLLLRRKVEAAGHHGRWIETTRAEYDNAVAALGWSRDEGTADDQLRLVDLIWRLWWVRGEFAEGRRWLESALERGADADARLRAPALKGAAGLAWAHGDNDSAEQLAGEARSLYLAAGDVDGEAGSTIILGHVAINRGRYDDARRYFERVRLLALQPVDSALAALNLGSVAHMAGNIAEAERHYAEAREYYASLGDRYGVALSRHLSGILVAEAGRYDEAAARLREALPVFVDLGFAQYTWQGVETAAAIAHARGDSLECVRLLSAAGRLRESAGTVLAPWERMPARAWAAAQAEVGEAAFATAWEEGRALTKEAALERALRVLQS
jgi:predicted ATPase/DNA-binding SARP family transcriptional activator